MTDPTPAPTAFEHKNQGEFGDDDSPGLTIPLSLLFGSVFLTIGGLSCCCYKDKICGAAAAANEPLLG